MRRAYGYLAGGYVRDKDAVVASMLICEMAAWYKGQGKNLGEALDDLYAQYGFYFNKVDSYTFPGSDGMAKMAALMETLRTEPAHCHCQPACDRPHRLRSRQAV